LADRDYRVFDGFGHLAPIDSSMVLSCWA